MSKLRDNRAMPAGLKIADEIMTREEEATLIARIEACTLSYYAMDPDNPRSSISFGWKYDFRNDSFIPCAPIPEAFQAVCAIAGAFAGVEPDAFAECLINRYEPGAIIQPHTDKPVWDIVVGISLGSDATMTFSKSLVDDQESFGIMMPARSMYLLSGDARYVYRHSLPPVARTRWSITLRTFSEEGLKLRNQYGASGQDDR
jgi:alkylated DNA repair dioxygenase AlkB